LGLWIWKWVKGAIETCTRKVFPSVFAPILAFTAAPPCPLTRAITAITGANVLFDYNTETTDRTRSIHKSKVEVALRLM
jgi:hypothetical protein